MDADKDREAAVQYYSSALKVDKGHRSTLLALAKLLSSSRLTGDQREATRLFERALRASSLSALADYGGAGGGAAPAATTTTTTTTKGTTNERFSEKVEVLLEYAKHLDFVGNASNWNSVDELYREALKHSPRSSLLCLYYARFLDFRVNAFRKARDYYERAVKYSPHSADALYALGSFLIESLGGSASGELRGGVGVGRKQQSGKPNLPPPPHPRNLGDMESDKTIIAGESEYGVQDDYDVKTRKEARVEALLGEALAHDPQHVPSLVLLAKMKGNVLSRMDEMGFGGDMRAVEMRDYAEQLLERAVRCGPRNPAALRSYALFLHTVRGDVQAALEILKRAVKCDPEHAATLTAYALLLMHTKNRYRRAQALLLRAIEIDPYNVEAMHHLACYYEDVEGNTKEAKKLYASALDVNRSHVPSLIRLGGLLSLAECAGSELQCHVVLRSHGTGDEEKVGARECLVSFFWAMSISL